MEGGATSSPHWVDTHCHLDSLEGDLESFLERASLAGVEHLVTIGTDLESSRTAIGLAERHDRVWAAVGVHPHDAENFDGEAADAIEEMSRHGRVVAVGEVGMDFYRDYASPEAQERTFRAQIDIAKRVGKPLVMHIREAFGEVLALLEDLGPPERAHLPLLLREPQAGGTRTGARRVRLVGRQRLLQKCRAAEGRCPGRCLWIGCWLRPTRPTWRRCPSGERKTSRATLQSRDGAGSDPRSPGRGAGGSHHRQRDQAFPG